MVSITVLMPGGGSGYVKAPPLLPPKVAAALQQTGTGGTTGTGTGTGTQQPATPAPAPKDVSGHPHSGFACRDHSTRAAYAGIAALRDAPDDAVMAGSTRPGPLASTSISSSSLVTPQPLVRTGKVHWDGTTWQTGGCRSRRT